MSAAVTFRGVQVLPGQALLLANERVQGRETPNTRAVVSYDDSDPVVIRELVDTEGYEVAA